MAPVRRPAAAASAAILFALSLASAGTPDSLFLRSFKARSIGPATMGGRVSSIAFDPEDPTIFYVGLGTGGVMKTANNGATFDAIFEKESSASIGAVAVSGANPKHLWAGTGEANDRNSSGWGNGVYRSTDGGETWKSAGLANSKTIARIALHPKDTNTVYVAAMGDLWTPGPERGLFKSTDGGHTWSPVLTGPDEFRDRIGCGDVILDPSNPAIVYAALYARRRTPWSFDSGAAVTGGRDAGGIFKSTDGGGTWKKLTSGLPGLTGRIGLDLYRKDPRIVYAIVQSDEGAPSSLDNVLSRSGGVFRSENGGEGWTRMSRLNPRPFYFSQIRIDPQNDQRVYVLGFMLHVSDDGGKSFQEDHFKNVHPDCHDLVIDPRNTRRLLLGTDGGVYQSFAKGKSWIFLDKMAAGEFYRVTVDMSTPFRIAGGLQDNLSWVGPSRTRSKEGILNSDWTNLGGGDGFYCAFDRLRPEIVYAESQEGYVHRTNLRTGEIKGIRPQPNEGQPSIRFHWNSPLLASQHDTGALYLAGNRIFKLTERGEKWRPISPDLSTGDPSRILTQGSGAENYGVVYTLAESPVKEGLLWAGTDDGKLWVTENEGELWTDLTQHLPKPVRGQWLGRIEPGHQNPSVAYLAVPAYRSGNYDPLLFRTGDRGKTWTSIAGNLPAGGPVHLVREDLKNPDLLFAGTEFGLYASLDRGATWTRFGGLPTVAVHDIVIHPRDRDLVIATHGRSLYVVDDITPLEEYTKEVAGAAVHLFAPRTASGFFPSAGWVNMAGSGIFRGANPPDGALIQYVVKEFRGEDASIAVATAAGRTVATLHGPGTPGFHRLVWDLLPANDVLNSYGGEGRKFMPSGDYTLTLTYGKTKEKQKLRVEVEEGIETR